MIPYRGTFLIPLLLASVCFSALAATRTSGVVAAGCPAGTVCDPGLGVSLTLPTDWQRIAADKVPAHVLGFVIPRAHATTADMRLSIASWGTTTDTNNRRAAAAGAERLIKGESVPTSRHEVRYAGAAGVLIRGLVGPGPVTAIVLVHKGAEYLILAPGASLASDQQQALRSLRFIARVGAFPTASPVTPMSTPTSRSTPVMLRVAPNPVKLGQAITVSVIGLKPGEKLRFQALPLSIRGFGGGNMGAHRANAAGTITFHYPAFTAKWEVGRWSISANTLTGNMVARAVVTVLERPSALTPRQMLFQYFANLNAHRFHAAWLLEAPCGIGYTFSNGPGASVGSAGFVGRGPWIAPRGKYAQHPILASAHVTAIRRMHIPILERNHIRAYGVSGQFRFDYTAAHNPNDTHRSGFHVIKIAMWKCNGWWGIEPSYWESSGGGPLNWT